MTLDTQIELVDCCKNNLVDPDSRSWFDKKLEQLDDPNRFFLNFGLINRKIKAAPIVIEENLERQIMQINPAFDIQRWTIDGFCRLVFLQRLPEHIRSKTIGVLLSTADIKEQISIFRSLQYLPEAEQYVDHITSGLRTNVVDVFDAIALDNAFPVKYLNEDAWNQMVLKAIFMERPLYRIEGLNERKNQKLASILLDFVHERWSAHRSVMPELWRMMSGFLTDEIFSDLQKVIENDQPFAKIAALKVIQESDHAESKAWAKSQQLDFPKMEWNEIGKAFWNIKNEKLEKR